MSTTMWDANGLHVGAEWTVGGDLRISGHHLRESSEYEYFITVGSADVPVVVTALGGETGSSGDDVLELLRVNGEMVVRAGELTWLKGLGLVPDFSSYSS